MPLTDTLYSETENAWFHYANHIFPEGLLAFPDGKLADAYLPQEHAHAGTRQAVARAAELGQASRARWSHRQLHELQNEANLREVVHDATIMSFWVRSMRFCRDECWSPV